jgi:hypothetical protein
MTMMVARHRLVGVIGTVVLVALSEGHLGAARLRPEALGGWDRYVAAVERRRGLDVRRPGGFFVMDTGPDAGAERRALLRGEVIVREMEAVDSRGQAIDVPSALVHHWRGAVFLPRANVSSLVSILETQAPPPGREILRSAVLERGPAFLRVFLRLERTKIVTVTLDTEHDVRFTRESSSRASSVSIATRIVEVESPGTPQERTLPPGDDRGFLWRLNAYWRYEAVPGGVIAECESISLSRGVPFGLQTIAGPLIGSAARESMERALGELVERAK